MKILRNALILEDHAETRQVLHEILQQVMPDIQVYETANLQQAQKALKKYRHFELVMVDISLPDGNGIDFVREVARQSPNSYIVMCTIYDDDKHVFDALRAGANGYLVKEHTREELKAMLQGILNGRPPLSPAIAQHILDSFHAPTEQNWEDLSPREIEVLTFVAKGYSRKETANLLNLSSNTVSWYIKQVYQKLDIHSKVEATLEASRMGLVR